MTVDEAIKSLEARVAYGKKNYPGYPTHDIQLGIEALKAVKEARLGILDLMPSALPGEAKE
ncbi:unnamed protein product [marine sediment metagenome]|uniref:Uncharacterized protein n=1 Tax=marine sediment metagenome TaxID=412755 RepID=X1P5Q3_9ZZZZ